MLKILLITAEACHWRVVAWDGRLVQLAHPAQPGPLELYETGWAHLPADPDAVTYQAEGDGIESLTRYLARLERRHLRLAAAA